MQKGSGQQNLVIHISGPQGSGKTTLGNKLKDKYGDKIYVKDLDDLYSEFYYQQDEIKNYQEFINNFISNHDNKPLIIVGLSAERCLGDMNDDNDVFYIIDTEYKFFIDIDENKILKQRFFRQIQKLNDRKEMFFNYWLKNNSTIQKILYRFIDLSKWKANNIACIEIHKEYNYKFMDSNDIFETINNLLHSNIK